MWGTAYWAVFDFLATLVRFSGVCSHFCIFAEWTCARAVPPCSNQAMQLNCSWQVSVAVSHRNEQALTSSQHLVCCFFHPLFFFFLFYFTTTHCILATCGFWWFIVHHLFYWFIFPRVLLVLDLALAAVLWFSSDVTGLECCLWGDFLSLLLGRIPPRPGGWGSGFIYSP